jgi:hypothetical protein
MDETAEPPPAKTHWPTELWNTTVECRQVAESAALTAEGVVSDACLAAEDCSERDVTWAASISQEAHLRASAAAVDARRAADEAERLLDVLKRGGTARGRARAEEMVNCYKVEVERCWEAEARAASAVVQIASTRESSPIDGTAPVPPSAPAAALPTAATEDLAAPTTGLTDESPALFNSPLDVQMEAYRKDVSENNKSEVREDTRTRAFEVHWFVLEVAAQLAKAECDRLRAREVALARAQADFKAQKQRADAASAASAARETAIKAAMTDCPGQTSEMRKELASAAAKVAAYDEVVMLWKLFRAQVGSTESNHKIVIELLVGILAISDQYFEQRITMQSVRDGAIAKASIAMDKTLEEAALAVATDSEARAILADAGLTNLAASELETAAEGVALVTKLAAQATVAFGTIKAAAASFEERWHDNNRADFDMLDPEEPALLLCRDQHQQGTIIDLADSSEEEGPDPHPNPNPNPFAVPPPQADAPPVAPNSHNFASPSRSHVLPQQAAPSAAAVANDERPPQPSQTADAIRCQATRDKKKSRREHGINRAKRARDYAASEAANVHILSPKEQLQIAIGNRGNEGGRRLCLAEAHIAWNSFLDERHTWQQQAPEAVSSSLDPSAWAAQSLEMEEAQRLHLGDAVEEWQFERTMRISQVEEELKLPASDSCMICLEDAATIDYRTSFEPMWEGTPCSHTGCFACLDRYLEQPAVKVVIYVNNESRVYSSPKHCPKCRLPVIGLKEIERAPSDVGGGSSSNDA